MSSLYGAVEERVITSKGEQWIGRYRAAVRTVENRDQFEKLADELTYQLKALMMEEPTTLFRVQVYKAPTVADALGVDSRPKSR